MQKDFTSTFDSVKKKALESPFYMKVYEDGGRYYEGEMRDGQKHGVGVLLT